MRHFLRQALSDFKSIGSVTPSSQQLARAMIEAADIKSRKVIVEFGPGTGVFTEQILKHKADDALYFALELNPAFVAHTQNRCPSATVYNDSAIELAKYLKMNGVEQCDCIISGLPFANFSEVLQDQILSAVTRQLSASGVFLTFAYNVSSVTKSGSLFRKKLPQYFDMVQRTKTIWGNLPPAFIYRAQKHAIEGALSTRRHNVSNIISPLFFKRPSFKKIKSVKRAANEN